jgi:hypothetical protein
MPRHPHPPLRDLLQHVQQDDEVWVPALIQSGRMGWLHWGVQTLENVHLLLYGMLLLGMFMALGVAWWVVAALAVVAVLVWLWRWKNPAQDHGLPLEWNGWRVDVPQRTLVRIGTLSDEAAQGIDTLRLEPLDVWSLGVVMGDHQMSKYVHAWRIELRHRNRGPAAVLCSVRSTSAAKVVMQDVDNLVDVLAQRLGIRRSGSRLVPLKR